MSFQTSLQRVSLQSVTELGPVVVAARDRIARTLHAATPSLSLAQVTELCDQLCLLAGQGGVVVGIQICREEARKI